MKHSLGPWTYDDEGWNTTDGIAWTIQGPAWGYYNSFTSQADARLIAAAPELLEAVKLSLKDQLDLYTAEALVARIEGWEGIMRDVKHTPGPWRQWDQELETIMGTTEEGKTVRIASVYSGDLGYGPNATLIAAAPSMLDTLKAILMVREVHPAVRILAENAITEATGEEVV